MRYADSSCTYEETIRDNVHGYVFTGPCIVTKKQYSVFVPSAQLYKYRKGALLQEAFSNMSASNREFLMSGCSPEGWDLVWKETEEDASDEQMILPTE